MDSSRRAVEAYWRSRMIDGATSDEDKVAPVYKLEEICELLRSSHVSIVKEVSEYIFKRLDNKSPVVKQKALRLIKYAVGKSGVEFRREMQRHSAAVRQLFHYKGQVDPLKGDALNKAVRDTAHEAISAIFASEESKALPAEDLNRRIEGFGNTNFEMPSDDKKSFLSEVVGLGSASIKQGFSSFTAAHSLRKNDTGTYKSPTLRKSLTTDMNSSDRFERGEHHSETRSSSGFSSGSSGTWGQDSNANVSEMTNGDSSLSYAGSKGQEERLLETVITTGGVRLQPTRDVIQVFLVEASKLDAVALSRALETKLQSHLWQVRMKAVCVLESILRKKDDAHFAVIASYFSENKDAVVKCSESPQASLREKAMKVLSLLDGEYTTGTANLPENPSSVKTEATVVVQLPDLIDTGDSDDYYGQEEFDKKQSDANGVNLMTAETPVTNDLFGDSLISDISTNEKKNEDPFAGVSFHTTENSEHVDDLFSGLNVDDEQQGNFPANKKGPELLDIFGPSSELMQEPTGHNGDLQDLLAGMSINENNSDSKRQGVLSGTLSQATLDLSAQPNHQVSNDALSGAFGSQMAGMNPNAMFPLGHMQYNMPPGIMLNQAFASNPMSYGAMESLLTQQQLLAAMSNFQAIGNLSAQPNANLGNVMGNGTEGGYSSPLPDIFNPNMPVPTHSAMLTNSKKEETKAFDFISDHLSAARGSKRLV